MMHASVLNRAAAAPTTAEITRSAHRAVNFGRRMFPAGDGLILAQITGAIQQMGLAPIHIQGNHGHDVGFSRATFTTTAAPLLRAGYPLLCLCRDTSGHRHAVCVVGFREVAQPKPVPNEVSLADEGIKVLYVHDDNLGPSVRMALQTYKQEEGPDLVTFRPDAPQPYNAVRPIQAPGEPFEDLPDLIPTDVVVAVHPDLRTHPSALQIRGTEVADALCQAVNKVLYSLGRNPLGLNVTTRFITLPEYVNGQLATLVEEPKRLGELRLRLWEDVRPMSLRLGLVRVTLGSGVMMDVLYDTTDTDRHLTPFCRLVATEPMEAAVESLMDDGTFINAPLLRM